MAPPPASGADRRTALVPDSRQRPGDDPIFALLGEANARAAAGENILNATLGALADEDGRLSILPTVVESLRSLDPVEYAAYAPIAGLPDFLEGVRSDLFGDHALRAASVAVATPGGTGACYAAIANFLAPGEKLLTTSYFWEPYAILADHGRRGIATFRSFDGRGRLDVEDLERQLSTLLSSQERALVILNTPCHNPTGYSLDDEEWAGVTDVVLRAARKQPVTLLLDHAYARFADESTADWRTYAEQIAEGAQFLVAWTASKSFTLYGGRVGAAVAVHPDEGERDRLWNALSYSARGTWSNGNRSGQRAVARILSDPALRDRCDAERRALVAGLSQRVERFKQLAADAGLSHPRYEGGFFVCVFADDPRAAAARMRERGVYVVPVQGALRVALCATPLARIPELVDALVDAGCARAGSEHRG